MNVATIVTTITPARAADSAVPAAAGGFAALLTGQAVSAETLPPTLASSADQGQPVDRALGDAPMPDIQNELGQTEGELPASTIADAPAPSASSRGGLPAPGPASSPKPHHLADAQPAAPIAADVVEAASVLATVSEADKAVSVMGPELSKTIGGDEIDHAGKADPRLSGTTDPTLPADATLPPMASQDPTFAIRPEGAMATSSLATASAPSLAQDAEAVTVTDAGKGGGHGETSLIGSSAPQPGTSIAHQSASGAADKAMDGAGLPANPGDASVAASVSRHAAFSDIYAARHQPATSPVIAAQPGKMGRDMGVEIARQVTAGRSEMLVRLDPPEMGRIDIRLSFDHDGGLRAVMSVDHHGALDLLRRETGDLTRALVDAGVKADAQSFRFDSRGGEAGQRGQQHQSGQQHGREAGTAGSNVADEQPLYRGLRTSGSVDLMA
jgi:flagellar hook-length control protein FliK